MASANRFKAQIKKYELNVSKVATQKVREVALKALVGVVEKTPVDMGTLKGNWNVGINTANTSFDETKSDTGGTQVISDGNSRLMNYQKGNSIHISNSMPYADRIENGYSPQSSGMISRTYAEIKSFLSRQRGKV